MPVVLLYICVCGVCNEEGKEHFLFVVACVLDSLESERANEKCNKHPRFD